MKTAIILITLLLMPAGWAEEKRVWAKVPYDFVLAKINGKYYPVTCAEAHSDIMDMHGFTPEQLTEYLKTHPAKLIYIGDQIRPEDENAEEAAKAIFEATHVPTCLVHFKDKDHPHELVKKWE